MRRRQTKRKMTREMKGGAGEPRPEPQLPEEMQANIMSYLGGPWKREESLLQYHAQPVTGLVQGMFQPSRSAAEVYAVKCCRERFPWDSFLALHLLRRRESANAERLLMQSLPYMLDLTGVNMRNGLMICNRWADWGSEPDEWEQIVGEFPRSFTSGNPWERWVLPDNGVGWTVRECPRVIAALKPFIKNPEAVIPACLVGDYYQDVGGVEEEYNPERPLESSAVFHAGRMGFMWPEGPWDHWNSEVTWRAANAIVALGWQGALSRTLQHSHLVMEQPVAEYLRRNGVIGIQ